MPRNVEIISEATAKKREAERREHAGKVAHATGFLLELAREQPFARWCKSDIAELIATRTGITKQVVSLELSDISKQQTPLDEYGSTLLDDFHEGSEFIQVVRPAEEVQALPDNTPHQYNGNGSSNGHSKLTAETVFMSVK